MRPDDPAYFKKQRWHFALGEFLIDRSPLYMYRGDVPIRKWPEANVPPLILKKGHVAGPKTAFAFLKLRLTS